MALIFVVSAQEVHLPMARLFPLKDKGLHFVEYAVMGWLCIRATQATWPRATRWRWWGYAVFVSVVWGLSDELHQALVPGRSAELADLVADMLGASTGASLWIFKEKKKTNTKG